MALHPRKSPFPLPSASIALFAGGAGLELGLSKAVASLGGHLRTVCYVEREAYAAAVLVARMEEQRLDPAPIWDLVESFDGTPWYGKVDLVAGGSPCQNMSLAGKREGLEGDRSILFFQLVRIVREVFPRYVVWENVAGAVKFLPDVLDAFERVGYFVGERDEGGKWSEASSPSVVAVRASDVGAPHKRERVFLLGVRQDVWDAELGRRCGAVANSERDSLRDEQGRRSRPGREGSAIARDESEELEHTSHRGARTAQQPRRERSPLEAGGELADIDGGRLREQRLSETPDANGSSTLSSDELANSRCERGREIRSASKSGESKSKLYNQRRSSELPYWPPGTEDAELWQQVLQVRPDLSPALPVSPFCGVADELASGLDGDPAELSAALRQALSNRADRLRLLGNGVVPDQAAQAFLILWEKLMRRLR